VESLRERVSDTEQLIADVEQRNAERYAAREAAMKEIQQRRAEALNRI
jgi:hypothetical protein